MRRKITKYLFHYIWPFVKCIIIILICIIVLSPGWLMDSAYHTWLDWHGLMEILKYVKMIGNRFHFSYGKGEEFLKSGFGILVTSISLMVTMGMNFAIRSENKVFGISRIIWRSHSKLDIFNIFTKIVFCFPLFMILAIHWDFCLTGYWILLWSYFYLTYSYLRLSNSFKRSKDYEMIVHKLVNITKIYGNNTTLKIYLESMRGEIEVQKSWANVEELFHQMVEEVKDSTKEKCFTLCYYFFTYIYIQDNKRWQRGFDVLKNRIYHIGQETDEESEYIVVWAMLTSIFFHGNEDMIRALISWIIKISSQDFYESEGKIIFRKTLDIAIGMTLIQTECFWRRIEHTKLVFMDEFERLFYYGEKFMQKKYSGLLEECVKIGNRLPDIEWRFIEDSVICLRENRLKQGYCVIYNMLVSFL